MIFSRKAISNEIIGGVLASVIIIAIIVFLLMSVGSSAIEEANKNSISFLATEVAKATNVYVSGTEHTTSAWAIQPESDFVYAAVYIPYSAAQKIQQQWFGVLDWKSNAELDKCTADYEACLCMFKAKNSCDVNNMILLTSEPLQYSVGSSAPTFLKISSGTRLGQQIVPTISVDVQSISFGLKQVDKRFIEPITVTVYEGKTDPSNSSRMIPDESSPVDSVELSADALKSIFGDSYDVKTVTADFSSLHLQRGKTYFIVLKSEAGYSWSCTNNKIANIPTPMGNGVMEGVADLGNGKWSVTTQAGVASPIFEFSVAFKDAWDSKYSYELYKLNDWIEYSFLNAGFKEPEFLKCEPLKSKGCTYIDSTGQVNPCVLHYDGYVIAWMQSSSNRFFKAENIIIDMKQYDDAGSYPQLRFVKALGSDISQSFEKMPCTG